MATKYKWTLTLSKFLWVAAEVVIAGVVCYLTENQYFMGIVPFLEALRNWLKHR